MRKVGLSDYIPKRNPNQDGQPRSLSSNINRRLENWYFSNMKDKLNDGIKKEMLAYTLQIMVLLMTSTTCYKFGGKIYR